MLDTYKPGVYLRKAMAPESRYWRMADRLTDGHLAEILNDHRARNLGYEDIARRLFADHGIEVTRQTVATWCERVKEAA